jgi:hypothetical protein
MPSLKIKSNLAGFVIMSQSKENEAPRSSLKRNSTSEESPFAEALESSSCKKMKLDDNPITEEISDEDEEFHPAAEEEAESNSVNTDEASEAEEPIDNEDYEQFKAKLLAEEAESEPKTVLVSESPRSVSKTSS